MPYASVSGPIGYQQVAGFGLPDTTERMAPGFTTLFEDPYWGSLEAVYVRANGAIRQNGLVVLTPTLVSGRWRWDATEVPNMANLGRPLYVALTAMTSGQFGWVANAGVVPVNCQASVAADTTFGIAAAGQGGANSAGKQVLNARIIAPGSTTVAKANCVANSGSNQLRISGADGWFCGVYLSGTGIAAGTTVTDISPDGTTVTLSANTTAAVNGTVTATYNNATVFYNVAHIDRPFAQGAIT
jgi:hypothetical protein